MKRLLFILLSVLLFGCSKDDDINFKGGDYFYYGNKYVVSIYPGSPVDVLSAINWPIKIWSASNGELLFEYNNASFGVSQSGNVIRGYDVFSLEIVFKSETSFIAYPRENTSEFALPDEMVFKLGASK